MGADHRGWAPVRGAMLGAGVRKRAGASAGAGDGGSQRHACVGARNAVPIGARVSEREPRQAKRGRSGAYTRSLALP
jgi:hypothetical protein